MQRHGRPENSMTDLRRSNGAALQDLGRVKTARQVAGSTTGLRTHTCHSDDASGRCCWSGACECCKSSRLSMPQSKTTFRRSVTSRTAITTNSHAPTLSVSGAAFLRTDTSLGLGGGDWFAFV
jgi:hypothetical protein